jgi:hypothetical protein
VLNNRERVGRCSFFVLPTKFKKEIESWVEKKKKIKSKKRTPPQRKTYMRVKETIES